MKKVEIKNKVVARGGGKDVKPSAATGADLSGVLMKSVWDEAFSIRETEEGEKYLQGKLPMALENGMATYVDVENPDLPGIYDGLPIDNSSIYWKEMTQADGKKTRILKADASGMSAEWDGYVVLVKDVPLDKQMVYENTIYEIRYDFDLGGDTLEIPADCVLYFKGGSLRNGKIVFNNTKISGEIAIDKTCSPSGSLVNTEVLVDWFGADSRNGTDNTEVVRNVIKLATTSIPSTVSYESRGFIVKFGQGTYKFDSPLVDDTLDIQYVCLHFEGVGMEGGTQITYRGADDTFMFDNWCSFSYSTFKGIRFVGNNKNNFCRLKSNYTKSGTQSFNFTDCRWAAFHKAFVSEGDTMTSEVSFINCKFVVFDENSIVFTFNNLQCVNWRFFGTDIEQTNGIIFQMLQGTYLSLYNSSIIPFKGIVINIPASATTGTFWYTNYPQICMYSCRFELRDYSKLFVSMNQADTGLIMNNCSLGGMNITPKDDVYQIEVLPGSTTNRNNAKFVFNDCTQFDNYKARLGGHTGTINEGRFDFNRCRGFNVDTFLANSVFPVIYQMEYAPTVYVDGRYIPYSDIMAFKKKQVTSDYIIKSATDNLLVSVLGANATATFQGTSYFRKNTYVGALTFNIMPNVKIRVIVRNSENTKIFGDFNVSAWANFDMTVKVGLFHYSENLRIDIINLTGSSGVVQGVIKVSEVYDNANRVPFWGVDMNPNGNVDTSFCVYKDGLKIPVWWDGTASTWRDAEGFRTIVKRAATTAELAGPNAADVGMMRYNTTLGKPVWWNGSKWVDANGDNV